MDSLALVFPGDGSGTWQVCKPSRRKETELGCITYWIPRIPQYPCWMSYSPKEQLLWALWAVSYWGWMVDLMTSQPCFQITVYLGVHLWDLLLYTTWQGVLGCILFFYFFKFIVYTHPFSPRSFAWLLLHLYWWENSSRLVPLFYLLPIWLVPLLNGSVARMVHLRACFKTFISFKIHCILSSMEKVNSFSFFLSGILEYLSTYSMSFFLPLYFHKRMKACVSRSFKNTLRQTIPSITRNTVEPFHLFPLDGFVNTRVCVCRKAKTSNGETQHRRVANGRWSCLDLL